MLQNGSGTHFGASQCISMGLAAAADTDAAAPTDADADADARCVYTLNQPLIYMKPFKKMFT